MPKIQGWSKHTDRGSVRNNDRYTAWWSDDGEHAVMIDMPPIRRGVHRLQTPNGSTHSSDRKFLEKMAVDYMRRNS